MENISGELSRLLHRRSYFPAGGTSGLHHDFDSIGVVAERLCVPRFGCLIDDVRNYSVNALSISRSQ